MGRREERRKRAEEQERKSKSGTIKSGRTRTERSAQKNQNRANDQKNRNGAKTQRTRRAPTSQKPSKGKANATPTPSPPPQQGRSPRCLAVATNKTTNKTTDIPVTSNRHSCCRPNCTRPFGPRSVVTSTIPALDRAGYTLILFLLSPTLPLPPLGGRGRRQSNKQNKTMNLNISPPCLPQLVNKKKKKYITKQHDNKTTHKLQANLRANHGHS